MFANSSDRTAVNYTVYGSGDNALVFVHGWSCDQNYWAEQIQAFSNDYHVVTLDLAGHGRSGTERRDYTIEAFAEDVVAVVKSLELSRVVLIGHSMGGPIIIEAASMIPDRVVALIGVETQWDLDSYKPPEEIPEFISPFRAQFRKTTYDFVSGLFSPDTRPELIHSIAGHMASADPDIAVSAMENMFIYLTTDYREKYKRATFPKYFINGADFRKSNRDSAAKYGVIIKELKGVGHFPMQENPDGFNQMLADTLSEIMHKQGP